MRSRKAADLDHPCGGRNANRLSPGSAKSAHKFEISQWIGRADIHWTGQSLISDQEVDGADEVGFVDPGNVLSPGSLRSAKSAANQVRENFKTPPLSAIKVMELRMAILRVSRVCPAKKAALPILRDPDRKIPCIRSAWFVATEFPGHLVHRPIKCVAIDSGGARVKPQSRRVLQRCNNIVEQPGRNNARIVHLPPILCVIAAVHAASGQVDAHVALLQRSGPWANRLRVPVNHLAREPPLARGSAP